MKKIKPNEIKKINKIVVFKNNVAPFPCSKLVGEVL